MLRITLVAVIAFAALILAAGASGAGLGFLPNDSGGPRHTGTCTWMVVGWWTGTNKCWADGYWHAMYVAGTPAVAD